MIEFDGQTVFKDGRTIASVFSVPMTGEVRFRPSGTQSFPYIDMIDIAACVRATEMAVDKLYATDSSGQE